MKRRGEEGRGRRGEGERGEGATGIVGAVSFVLPAIMNFF
jgi:hypothetical protein